MTRDLRNLRFNEAFSGRNDYDILKTKSQQERD